MQCSFLVVLVMSCLALSISAAPVPAPNPDAGLAILDRTFESAEVARAPEPEPACRLYSCI
ncbi:hypothetical protein B0H11DRAFT_2239877 [Mycena galericulata]|nr:hypothetical protein B0H11DRAFT_2239877 [Mycena galericulata]